jgi:hypothetical protein
MTSTSRLAALVETMSNPNKTSGDESGSSSRGPEAKDERKVKRERKQVAAATSSSGAGYPTTAQAQARRAGRSPPTISRRARNQTQTRNQLSVRQNHLPQTNHHLKIPLNISPLVPYVPPSYLVLSLALVLVHTRHPQMTVPMRATCLRRGRVLKRANVIAQKALPDES